MTSPLLHFVGLNIITSSSLVSFGQSSPTFVSVSLLGFFHSLEHRTRGDVSIHSFLNMPKWA